MPLFCRHNRLATSCPICSREQAPDRRPGGGRGEASPARARTGSPTSPRRSTTSRGSGRLVTRQLARAADDGYRNDLVPGLRATADARRLGAALVAAAARLEPPGPYPELATEPDRERATWLAFLLALAGADAPDEQARLLAEPPPTGDVDALPAPWRRTAHAFQAWAQKAGSLHAAFTGEAEWTPSRRFGRLFERLSLPGLGRAPRYELLTALGAAELYPLEADALRVALEDDATTLAAKRLLVSGDARLLERRAAELAQACAVPLGALDRGLAAWGTPSAPVDLEAPLPDAVRRALRVP